MAACIFMGCIGMGVPVTIALIIAFLRWSPLMLPYHVFGDTYQLMKMETEGSLKYCSVVLLDWTLLTECSNPQPGLCRCNIWRCNDQRRSYLQGLVVRNSLNKNAGEAQLLLNLPRDVLQLQHKFLWTHP